MITLAKEEAKELVERFIFHSYSKEDAKQCALICVDEKIEELKLINKDKGTSMITSIYLISRLGYLAMVRIEIKTYEYELH